jgi:hypothetical protein
LVSSLIRNLRLPCPLQPPRHLLIRDDLCFPDLPQEILIFLTKSGSVSSQAIAVINLGGAGVGRVIASANSTAIDAEGAVSRGRRSFFNDDKDDQSLCKSVASLVSGVDRLFGAEGVFLGFLDTRRSCSWKVKVVQHTASEKMV